MLIYGAILLSFLITFSFYIFKHKEYTWQEFFLPTATTLLVVLIFKWMFILSGNTFSEYWGSTIVSAHEQEPYNYWVHRTCTRQVPSGKDSNGNTTYTTETYDCSYQSNVGPSWWVVTNLNEHIYVSESVYDSLVLQFNTPHIITKTRKNHSARSSAAGSRNTKFANTRVGEYSYVRKVNWPETDESRKAMFTMHSYKNKIKASDLSIFNIKVVSRKDIDTLGLFQYPKLSSFGGSMYYPTILAQDSIDISAETKENFRKLNGKFGPTNELRLWVLVFDDKPRTAFEYQKNYWVRGNMNEFVICMSVKDTTLQWADAFTWSTNEMFTIKTRNYISNIGVVNDSTWNNMYHYLNNNLDQFKRRDFSEFDYLKRRNKPWEIIIAYIFGICAAVITNIWACSNEYKDRK